MGGSGCRSAPRRRWPPEWPAAPRTSTTSLRVAALYDIHGNLPALEAVLTDVEREDVDLIVVGGDFASGPFPRETLERLLALRDRALFVRGNADRWVADAVPEHGAAWAAAKLTAEQRAFLAGLSLTAVVEVDGFGPVLFCHAVPWSDEPIFTRITPPERVRELLGEIEQRVVVVGHTHVQFDRLVDGIRVVNAGSVGMPYEGERGAYWALLGPDVEMRRTRYDVEAAVEAIRATGMPERDDLVDWLLTPPSPEEVTEFFERQAAESGR